MALTILEWSLLPDPSQGNPEIVDTVDNIINNVLFDVPIVGPLLKQLLLNLVGNGQATITALVPGSLGLSGLSLADLTDLADMGTSLLDPQGDSVLSLAQALLIGGNGLGIVDDVVATVETTISDLLNLDASDITDLVTSGVDLLAPLTGGTIPLDLADLLSGANLGFVDDVVITVLGTVSEIASLQPQDIAALAGIGIDIISVGGGILQLTLAQVSALLTNGLALASLDVVVLLETAENIVSMTLDLIGDLLDLGIDIIDVLDGTVYLTVAQAKAFAQSNVAFEPDDVVVIRDTGANIAAMTVSDINLVATINVDEVDAIGNQLALSLAQIGAFGSAGIGFATGDAITVADTGANIAGLSDTQIADLAAQGITAVDATNNAITLDFDTFEAFGNAAIALTQSDVVTLQGAGGQFEALTGSAITALAADGIDILDASDNAVTLDVAQAKAFANAGLGFAGDDVVAIADTGANIATLSTSEIADLKAGGVDVVDATDDVVNLSAAQAKAFASAGLALASGDLVTLVDTGASIANLTLNEIAAIKAAGVDGVDATNNAVSLTIAKALAFADAGLGFGANDVVGIIDTGASVAALTAQNIADLAASGVDTIDVSDNAVSLTAAQIGAFIDGAITFAGNDVVTLADTGANIAGLDAAAIAALVDAGVDLIDVSDDAISITVAQALAYVAAGLTFADDDIVTLADLGANIEGLTATQIQALEDIGVDLGNATNDAVSLTIVQAQAYVDTGIAFADADVVKLADTGASLAALTAEDLADIKAIGVDSVDATDNNVALTLAQADGFVTNGLAFAANDVVKLVDAGSGFTALTTVQIAALDAMGADMIDATNNAFTMLITQAKALSSAGITIATDDTAVIADIGANIAALTASDIAALATAGFDAVDVTNNLVSLTAAQLVAFGTAGIAFAVSDTVRLADTGTNIAALTADQIGDMVATGADSVDLTDNAITLTVAQVKAFATAGLAFATGDVLTLSDTGANVAALTTAEIAGIKDTGVDLINLSDNQVTLSLAQYNAIGTLDFAAEDIVTVLGTAGRDTITADGGNMIIRGARGRDVLTAGADHTTLSGGAGRDRLIAGAGEDTFLFDALARGANTDRVKGYDTVLDHIALEDSIFRAIGATLERSEFHLGRRAADGSDNLIYDRAHGALFYDRDGEGGHHAVKIAQFEHGLRLNIADFDMV